MRRSGSFIRGVIILVGGVGLALVASITSLPGQNHSLRDSPVFRAGIRTHESQTKTQTVPGFPEIAETPAQAEFEMPAPTRSTFMARWASVTGATGYLLDVSTSNSLNRYVEGFSDLDISSVTERD